MTPTPVTLAVAFKEIFGELDLTLLSTMSLTVFVLCFVGMAGWALAQRRDEVRHWSAMPLADDAAAVPAAGGRKEQP